MRHRLLEGFDGKLASSKLAAIPKCSPDTVLRDSAAQMASVVLHKTPAGAPQHRLRTGRLTKPWIVKCRNSDQLLRRGPVLGIRPP
jgi:hypothetical protein